MMGLMMAQEVEIDMKVILKTSWTPIACRPAGGPPNDDDLEFLVRVAALVAKF